MPCPYTILNTSSLTLPPSLLVRAVVARPERRPSSPPPCCNDPLVRVEEDEEGILGARLPLPWHSAPVLLLANGDLDGSGEEERGREVRQREL